MRAAWVAWAVLAVGCGRPALPRFAVDAGAVGVDAQPSVDSRATPDTRPPRDIGGAILPARVMVFLSQVRDQKSGAEQGSARVLATPDPHPYFAATRALTPVCGVYPSSVVGLRQLDLGAVSFSGGPQSYKLDPERPLKVGEFLYPGILFPKMFGDTSSVRISATGGQLPGFTSSVGGVRRLTVAFPRSPLDRRGKLALTLSGGDSGRAELTIVGVSSASTVLITIRCRFDYDAKATQVFDFGSAVLAALPVGTAAISMLVGRVNETAIEPRPQVRVHLLAAYYTSTQLAIRP